MTMIVQDEDLSFAMLEDRSTVDSVKPQQICAYLRLRVDKF